MSVLYEVTENEHLHFQVFEVCKEKCGKPAAKYFFLITKSFTSLKAWESHVKKEVHHLQLAYMVLIMNTFFSSSSNMCIHTHITVSLHYILSKTTTG